MESKEITNEDLELVLDRISNTDLVKASRAAAFAMSEMAGTPDALPSPQNTEEWIGLYTDHIWAYVGVFAIASTIAQLNPQLKKRIKASGEIEEVQSHAVLSLLRDPNNDMTLYDLLESLLIYLETCGDAYWEISYKASQITAGDKVVVSEKEIPAELWPILPSRITPIPRKDGKGIEKYQWQLKRYAKKEYFKPEEIVPFHYYDPLKDWTGMGSLKPALDDIRQDKQMALWNLDFFKHGTTPEGLISTDERLTQTEVDNLGKQIREFLKGKGRTVMILSRGLKWQTISLAPKDIDFLMGRKGNREAILAALGVPPVKAGLLEHAKFDNYALQLEAFHRDTIIPKIRKVESVLQKFLIPRFDDLLETDEYEFIIQFDTTPLLKQDEDQLVKRLVLMIEFGLASPNECRKKLRLEPYTGGEIFFMNTRVRPILGPEPPPQDSDVPFEPGSSVAEKREEANISFEDRLNTMEKRIAEALDGYREDIERRVVDDVLEQLRLEVP